MKVSVRIFGDLRKVLGHRIEVTLPAGSTVSDLLERLDSGERSAGVLEKFNSSAVYILRDGLNGELLDGIDTALKDGAVVSILPPAGGG